MSFRVPQNGADETSFFRRRSPFRIPLTPASFFGHSDTAGAAEKAVSGRRQFRKRILFFQRQQSTEGRQTMEVILAGHNIDYEIIREIAAAHPERQDLTPETVAAAYARISRNPRPVNELRTLARGEVEKARASNRNIVFEMGHSSIAEHAVFNLDVLDGLPPPRRGDRKVPPRLLYRKIPAIRPASGRFRHPRRGPPGRSGGGLRRNRPGAEPLLPRAVTRSSAPSSSTRIPSSPPIRPTARSSKGGPRRTPATSSRSPRRPSSG